MRSATHRITRLKTCAHAKDRIFRLGRPGLACFNISPSLEYAASPGEHAVVVTGIQVGDHHSTAARAGVYEVAVGDVYAHVVAQVAVRDGVEAHYVAPS